MAQIVDRLEKCLCAWEDFWFLIGVLNQILINTGRAAICPKEGAVVYWQSFRKHLLHLHSTESPPDMVRFQQPTDMHNTVASLLISLPIPLTAWCQQSRRVYRLQPEIQTLLNATSLEGVKWSDVSFPFPAFAVSLGQPIKDNSGMEIDFLLFSKIVAELPDRQPVHWIDLRGFAPSCGQYDPLTDSNRQNMRQRIKDKQWEHGERLVLRFFDRLKGVVGTYFSLNAALFDEVITNTAQRVSSIVGATSEESVHDSTISICDSTARIVVGMCLYLQTLPLGSPHRSAWRPSVREGRPDPRAISNEAEVCTVSSCYTLTRPERVALGLEGTAEERRHYELSCHFRQGHWRRPPGYGHIPDAPKTVHVRPCLVRKDRLQAGELPGGAETVL